MLADYLDVASGGDDELVGAQPCILPVRDMARHDTVRYYLAWDQKTAFLFLVELFPVKLSQ